MENRNGREGLGRRQILRNAGAVTATAALMSAVRASFPGGAFAQAAGPETNKVTLGFIALTDASPLIIAKEKKIFDKYGITDANVAKQASWGTTRDNLVLGGGAGGIDGAHILTPKPYQISLGTTTPENRPVPMYILARLNYDCQGLSVSNEFKGLGATIDAKPLKEAFAKKKAAGKEVKCAMTFPGGTHDLWIRYWLAAAGIDPDKDVSTIVVPPPQMVANMKVGNMDAFCVGEPWNEQLVNQDIGFTAAMTGELWMNHPEKSLGMRADWVDKNPKAAMADADGGDGSPAVVRQDGEQAGVGQHHRQAPMVQRPARRHHQPHQGRVQLRRRTQGLQFQPADEVLEGRRFLPLPEPRTLVPHREPALGQAADGPRHQGDHRQGQSRGSVADGGQEHRRRRIRCAQDDVARQGNLLRRQGVRSRGSEGLSRQPPDQEGGVMQVAAKAAVSVANAVPVPETSAEIVPFRRPVRPALDRIIAALKHVASVVLPPLIVLSITLFVWQLLCSEPGAHLPPPTKVVADAWDFIADPFYDNGGIDKGAFWQISKSLGRVAIGFSLAAVVGIALGVLVGQSHLGDARSRPDLPGAAHRAAARLAADLSLAGFRHADPSAIFVIFITSIWPIIINTVGRACGTSRRTTATSRR
jgi:ABC-type nitrate/sulfonate/bicarbonate transport system substrate-binding protein